jgi:nicotinamidase-related amidase
MVENIGSRLAASADEYLGYLEGWLENLPEHEVKQPESTAILVVDITNGFCNEGALASLRVKAIVPPIVSLLNNAWTSGVREFYLLNDNHEPDAIEFKAFPPHCIRGTAESQPVQEIMELEFFDQMRLIEKNTLSSTQETELLEDLHTKPNLTDFIIVGDCTDLCVYQLAVALRNDANARRSRGFSIIVPEDCVDTYDMPVELAQQVGAAPHPGDFMHAVFLHHMALNGVSVVKKVQF